MPFLNEQQNRDVRLHAGRAHALTMAAQELRRAFDEVIAIVEARNSLGFAISSSRTGVALNFGVATAHTPIEAIFDHAFKDGDLVGRYRFFAVQEMPSGDIHQQEVWAVLFDANSNATSEPEGPFDWSFRPGDSATEASIGKCLLMLLSKIQEALPRYDSTFNG